MNMIAHLDNRTVLHIGGSEALAFLQNLITCDVEGLELGQAHFGALLTPQGKVLFDFIIVRVQDKYLLDIAAGEAEAFAKRLGFYKLRADVSIETTTLAVQASWPGNAFSNGYKDPRSETLGFRAYDEDVAFNSAPDEWDKIRIGCGVAQSGSDFQLGDVFPHDVLMDQFAGVDFNKGCYVGQEVVSRMHHRGTARNRIVQMTSKDGSSLEGLEGELQANEKKIGTAGSSKGSSGLALVRTDRAVSAMQASESIMFGTVEVELKRPDFATYDWIK